MKKLDIEDIPIFSGLDRGELDRLTTKLGECSFKSEDIILREGKIEEGKARYMYIIQKGAAEVLKEDWAMNQIRVNVLKKGDFFGEMSLIDNQARSATVRALSDITLYSLSHKDLEGILSQVEYAKVILNIGGEIAIRMGGSFLRMADLLKEYQLD